MVRIDPTGLDLWVCSLVTPLPTSPLVTLWLSSVARAVVFGGLVAYQGHLGHAALPGWSLNSPKRRFWYKTGRFAEPKPCPGPDRCHIFAKLGCFGWHPSFAAKVAAKPGARSPMVSEVASDRMPSAMSR